MNAKPPTTYAMTCPHCQVRLKVRLADLGTQRACPRCHQSITVGKRQTTDAHPARDSEAKNEFSLVCSACKSTFYATPNQIGQKLDCPDCLTEHVVPQPPKKPKTRTTGSSTIGSKTPELTEDVDDYQLQPFDSQPTTAPNRAPAPTFRFPCTLCRTMLQARPDQIGTKIRCHDCHSSVLVQKHRPASKPVRVVAKDPNIGITAAHELKVTRDNADQLMKKAHEHQEELERRRPTPPKRPFIDGVYGFPFRPRTFHLWLLPGIGSAMVIGLLQIGMRAQGLAQIGAIFMFLLASLLILALVFLTSNVLLLVMQTTATGLPEPDEYPSFDVGAWFGQVIYILSALFVSILPVLIFAPILPPMARGILGGIMCFCFFPIVLLSMLDSGSPAMPYSPWIARSLRHGARSWLKFFAATAVQWVICGAICFALIQLLATWGIPICCLMIMITALIHARLLGRLAWVLDRSSAS